MGTIVVIGSINMDVVSHVEHHPLPGETIHGTNTGNFPGGKGANQAVAAARSGASVTMLGAVGEDAFGQALKDSLAASGVGIHAVLTKTGTSGLAFIAVNAEGENTIILSAGANGQLMEADIEAARAEWTGASAILLQNEIPWETTRFVLEQASAAGVRVFLNPAPALKLPQDVFPWIDTIIVNETEAQIVTGIAVSGADSSEQAADALIGLGVRAAIVTLGEKGCFYKDKVGERVGMPAFRVEPKDTTAAGDTFIGAFAAEQASGAGIEQSLRFAAAASAIAVTKEGAQASIPAKADTLAFLQERA
ncbi:ribokinase [Paenibacillus phyllosphaerae]|uniref:Ribokinase n=1 Tax=Paenibacillus phyllosphaerae TaxID=274593 RepID=A0A7W5B0H4_9BACL|nr:ribokinase [Paenibacillus phyllosphaerae]MBB3112103.1 ribokinase [Paenibacillus phyllosphaerae]